ncbi:MAG: NAD(P)/FAD-dependent oxidoreductase [Gemmatimonadota bacterium]
MSRPRVVIVGGGFAGLNVAKRLGRLPADVTLIDRANHHVFQPLLYQVASAALNPADISKPIRSVLRRWQNVQVLLGEVDAVDLAGRAIHLTDAEVIAWDYLILAPGSRHCYFRHPEWEALAPGLKTLEDAVEVRRRILLAFERAERAPSAEERQRHLSFVVIGGGPTGVEVAGALAELKRYALRRDFRRIDPRDATVVLLEGGPRLLPSYPKSLSEKSGEILRRLGVDVRTDTMVTRMVPGLVEAGDWSIPTDTVIWAAGNVTSPLLRSLGIPLYSRGRAVVGPDCSLPGHPNAFVLGDAAAFADPRWKGGLPGVAPVAIQQGLFLGRLLRDELAGRPRRAFRYVNKGELAVIGRGQAVADFGRIRLAGFPAWFTWIFVHIAYLIGFASRVLVLFQWAWSYLTFERGARLITHPWHPETPPGDR